VQQDNDDVRELLRRYMAYRDALLRIVWRYQRYTEVDDDRTQAHVFLVDLTAASVLYDSSVKFVTQFKDSPKSIAKLNEPEPEWSIPAGFYDTIRRQLTSRENFRTFELARQYYHQPSVQEKFASYGLLEASPYEKFHTSILVAEDTILKDAAPIAMRITEVAIDDAADLLKEVQYKSQSQISTWIGDLKIRKPNQGQSLIGREQLERLSEVLQPGDVQKLVSLECVSARLLATWGRVCGDRRTAQRTRTGSGRKRSQTLGAIRWTGCPGTQACHYRGGQRRRGVFITGALDWRS